MFESRAVLDCHVSEAIEKFCAVANPTGKAFHLNFLLERLLLEKKKRGAHAKFFSSPSGICSMVKHSSQRALKRHLVERSTGPLPRQVTFMDFSRRRYSTIQYTSANGMTNVRLEINYHSNQSVFKTSLIVFGRNPFYVQMRAESAGLPKPKFFVPASLSFPVVPELLNVQMSFGTLIDLLYPLI